MRTVVADTSPVNYLVLIGEIEVLRSLFGEIILPPAVHRELLRQEAPAPVRAWAENLPDWVRVMVPQHIDLSINLGKGETEAISLAGEVNAGVLLIDERLGRMAARDRGIPTAGTILLLSLADERQLLDFDTAMGTLLKTNFRVSPAIVNAVRSQLRGRKK